MVGIKGAREKRWESMSFATRAVVIFLACEIRTMGKDEGLVVDPPCCLKRAG